MERSKSLVKVEGNKLSKLIHYWQYLYESGYWRDKRVIYIPSFNHYSKIK